MKKDKKEIIDMDAELMQFLKTVQPAESAPPAELDLAIKAAARKQLRRPKMIMLFYTSAASLAAVTALCCGLLLHSPAGTPEQKKILTDSWDWTELETEMITFSGELDSLADNHTWEPVYYGGMTL